jgi:hypothetical protein
MFFAVGIRQLSSNSAAAAEAPLNFFLRWDGFSQVKSIA